MIVRRSVAFHGGDFWIVEALRASAADSDDVAFVKFQPDDASHVALRFGDERLERFALGREPEAVVNELAVFRARASLDCIHERCYNRGGR